MAVIPTRDIKLGGVTVAQTPNGPSLLAMGARGVAETSTNSRTKSIATAVHFAALVVWGWLEATHGVNILRRLLGAAGLAYVAYELARRGGLLGDAPAAPPAPDADDEAAIPGPPRMPG